MANNRVTLTVTQDSGNIQDGNSSMSNTTITVPTLSDLAKLLKNAGIGNSCDKCGEVDQDVDHTCEPSRETYPKLSSLKTIVTGPVEPISYEDLSGEEGNTIILGKGNIEETYDDIGDEDDGLSNTSFKRNEIVKISDRRYPNSLGRVIMRDPDGKILVQLLSRSGEPTTLDKFLPLYLEKTKQIDFTTKTSNNRSNKKNSSNLMNIEPNSTPGIGDEVMVRHSTINAPGTVVGFEGDKAVVRLHSGFEVNSKNKVKVLLKYLKKYDHGNMNKTDSIKEEKSKYPVVFYSYKGMNKDDNVTVHFTSGPKEGILKKFYRDQVHPNDEGEILAGVEIEGRGTHMYPVNRISKKDNMDDLKGFAESFKKDCEVIVEGSSKAKVLGHKDDFVIVRFLEGKNEGKIGKFTAFQLQECKFDYGYNDEDEQEMDISAALQSAGRATQAARVTGRFGDNPLVYEDKKIDEVREMLGEDSGFNPTFKKVMKKQFDQLTEQDSAKLSEVFINLLFDKNTSAFNSIHSIVKEMHHDDMKNEFKNFLEDEEVEETRGKKQMKHSEEAKKSFKKQYGKDWKEKFYATVKANEEK